MPVSGRPRRSPSGWGWHSLTDEWAARLVAEARLRPGQLVLDVGAGTGAITVHLLAAGARVVAVELHQARAQLLRERFAGEPVTVLQVDAADLWLPRKPFRVVANPPFAVSSALLRSLLEPRSRLVAADLVLQRAVVSRWSGAEAPGARRWSRDYDLRRGRSLPRHAFRPPARVDAAVLRVQRR